MSRTHWEAQIAADERRELLGDCVRALGYARRAIAILGELAPVAAPLVARADARLETAVRRMDDEWCAIHGAQQRRADDPIAAARKELEGRRR